METIVPIVCAVLGSGALFGFIQFLIARHDNKKGAIASLSRRVEELQVDSLRTQLLLLIADYSGDRSEILRLAEKYFKDYHGNFYLSSIFTTWLKENKMDIPQWFKDN